jgi:hypothetical protein
LVHLNAKESDTAIVRAAGLQRGFHPCGALQLIRAPQRGGFLEEI